MQAGFRLRAAPVQRGSQLSRQSPKKAAPLRRFFWVYIGGATFMIILSTSNSGSNV